MTKTTKRGIAVYWQQPKVSLVAESKDAQDVLNKDELLAYIARISTSKSGKNPRRLLASTVTGRVKPVKYGITDNKYGGHVSTQETLNLGFMITGVSLFIVPQILRHRSNSFQQYSLRYAEFIRKREDGSKYAVYSIHSLPQQAGRTARFSTEQPLNWDVELEAAFYQQALEAVDMYDHLVEQGASYETARGVLPQAATTDLFVNFNIRSLVSFLTQRLFHGAQEEIRHIAVQLRDILAEKFPELAAEYDYFRFWSIMKGDDIISHKRYGYTHAIGYGCEEADLIPFLILLNRLDCRTADNKEAAILEQVQAKYKDRLEQLQSRFD